MSERATSIVDQLSAVRLEHVFNPYSDRCDLHDRADAAERRRRNLELSLAAAVDLEVRTIWIARDLGYLGGRRTGLALTDEAHLDAYSALFHGLSIEKATNGPPASERTARVIWRMLMRISEPVFLWNVFPLHPHAAGDPLSNRCHTVRERRACEEILHAVVALLRPDRIVAIGGDAHRAVADLGIESLRVRHPSYGGQNVFIRQIEEAYGLDAAVEPDLFTPPIAE